MIHWCPFITHTEDIPISKAMIEKRTEKTYNTISVSNTLLVKRVPEEFLRKMKTNLWKNEFAF